MNTCFRSHVRLYTQKSLWERSLPSWMRTNSLLMPTFLRTKATKCANPPHTGASKSWQYGDKAPLKPHISRGKGGSGFTLTGALREALAGGRALDKGKRLIIASSAPGHKHLRISSIPIVVQFRLYLGVRNCETHE